MRKAAARRLESISPTLLTRALILGYFVALACGIVSGADFVRLSAPLFPAPADSILSGSLVVILAGLVLLDVWRRAAALFLALILFWASYLSILAGHGADLGGFWRDVALIVALVFSAGVGKSLTVSELPPDSPRMDLSLLGDTGPGRIARPVAAAPQAKPRPRVRSRTLQAGVSRLYREDLDAARSS